MLNFTATDLQLYKIFMIMHVSFYGTQCRFLNQLGGSIILNPFS